MITNDYTIVDNSISYHKSEADRHYKIAYESDSISAIKYHEREAEWHDARAAELEKSRNS